MHSELQRNCTDLVSTHFERHQYPAQKSVSRVNGQGCYRFTGCMCGGEACLQGVHTGARERLRQPACSRDEKLREVGDIAWQGAKNSGRVPRIAAGVRELAWTC